MDLTIFVPTLGRTHQKPITLEDIKHYSNWIDRTIVVCPTNEADHYVKWGYQVMTTDVRPIGAVRQFILENSPTNGILMLDDDMYFSWRPNHDTSSLVRIPFVKDALDPMFQIISDWLDAGFVHGGISARQGNNRIERPFVDIIRVNNAHFFNKHVVMTEGLKFTDLEPDFVMEDFYMTLSLLLRGYPNRVLYQYMWGQRGSGLKGGCSTYRTAEMQSATAHKLKAAFPKYVRVVHKASESVGTGIFAEGRDDVNIQWLDAWQDHDIRLRKCTDFTLTPEVSPRRR